MKLMVLRNTATFPNKWKTGTKLNDGNFIIEQNQFNIIN